MKLWSSFSVVPLVFFFAMLFAVAAAVGDEIGTGSVAARSWCAVWHQAASLRA